MGAGCYWVKQVILLSSFAQLCLTLCDPGDCNTPGFPDLRQLLKLGQTHVQSQWCHPTISSSVIPASPPVFNFPQHQGLSQWVSSLHQVAKVLEFQLQHQTFQWIFPLGWTGWFSLQSKWLSRIFSNTTVQKHQFFCAQAFFIVQLSHPYMTTGKTIALTRWTFVGKVMSQLFNMLSRLVIAFLLRSKYLLTSWLQSTSSLILEPQN